MRVALAWLLVVCGCRSTGAKVSAVFVTGGAFAGFVYGIACADYTPSEHRCESSDANALGALIVIDLVVGIGAWIYSEKTYDPHPSEPAEAPPAAAGPVVIPGAALYEPVEPADPRAHQLAVQAHNAAARGQCASVPGLASRVLDLDEAYYHRVFAADPPIARCLAR